MTTFEGPCSCCDAGCGFWCTNFYCCGPCSMGKIADAYQVPGGFFTGCCCGGAVCCHYMIRSAVAKEHGIDDGMMSIICPCCCGPCSQVQIVNSS